jgi:hypothetical protein
MAGPEILRAAAVGNSSTIAGRTGAVLSGGAGNGGYGGDSGASVSSSPPPAQASPIRAR